jgi:hypothetical protein
MQLIENGRLEMLPVPDITSVSEYCQAGKTTWKDSRKNSKACSFPGRLRKIK